MGVFCVFGFDAEVINRRTEYRVGRIIAGRKIHLIPEDKIPELREKVRAKILATSKPKKLCAEFDAPQFCSDWIDLAKRFGKHINLIVMVLSPKKDKKGKAVIKNNAPVMTWVPYSA